MADDAKLADARKRVARAERKALDRALALRDEAEHLIEAARAQATKIREDAKIEAAKQRTDLEAELRVEREQAFQVEPSDSEDTLKKVAELERALEEARSAAGAAREERDAARAEVRAALEETKSARATRFRASASLASSATVAPRRSGTSQCRAAGTPARRRSGRDSLDVPGDRRSGPATGPSTT